MITNVGKSIASIQCNDGTVLNIFNRPFHTWGTTIKFNDRRGKAKYSIPIDQSYITNQYRCACFTRSYSNNTMTMTPHVLLYVPPTAPQGNHGITAQPLFELISPSVSKHGECYQLTWWSNVKDYKKLKSSNGIYTYDPAEIKRFSQSTLASESASSACGNILCTGMLYFEGLCQVGDGAFDTVIRPTPIIRSIAVIGLVTGQGYVTDFAGGGGGDGIGMHSHLNNRDGGFAAAVFMPSAVMKPFTWS